MGMPVSPVDRQRPASERDRERRQRPVCTGSGSNHGRQRGQVHPHGLHPPRFRSAEQRNGQNLDGSKGHRDNDPPYQPPQQLSQEQK